MTDINALVYPTELSIIILDHEQYSNFIAGYNYGITNTQMHELQLESKLGPNQFDVQNPRNLYESVYNVDMTENSYYLIIHWEYRTTFGSEDMQELADYRRESLDFENTYITFYYAVDLDYVPTTIQKYDWSYYDQSEADLYNELSIKADIVNNSFGFTGQITDYPKETFESNFPKFINSLERNKETIWFPFLCCFFCFSRVCFLFPAAFVFKVLGHSLQTCSLELF